MRSKRSQRGFTLMELMVVIVIVAILAAVAVPLYINYVKDAQRTEAKGAIAAVISAEQIYYQASPSHTYTNYSSADAQPTLKVDLSEIAGPPGGTPRNWTVTVSDASESGFKVTATHKTDPDLNVCCTYSRAADPEWHDGADCGSGGGQ